MIQRMTSAAMARSVRDEDKRIAKKTIYELYCRRYVEWMTM